MNERPQLPQGNFLKLAVFAIMILFFSVFGASAGQLPQPDQPDEVAISEIKKFISKSIDLRRGGFFPDLDADWRLRLSTDKAIVFQARLTWSFAEVAQRRPESMPGLDDATRHGMDMLTNTLWDADHGGFFWVVDAETPPVLADTPAPKHLYGNAFGIYAAANAYRALGDPDALDLARMGYQWVEEHARDPQHPGYYEVFTREGRPILTPPDGDPKASDMIGTAYGFKSMNTHLHLMEAYTELYRVWPDPELRERLTELLGIVRDTMTVEPGAMNMFFTPDWRAVPGHDSFGHDVEAAYLMLETAELLGERPVEETLPIARSLVDHALLWGYDEELGGFYDAGGAWGEPHDTTKVWWAQAEALNALLLMDDHFGDETDAYREAFAKTWEFTETFLIDNERGGWRWSVQRDGAPIGPTEKSNNWKGPYHTVRAMLNIADRLRERREDAP